MKKYFYLTILMAAMGFNLFSKVNAYLNFAVFYAPAQGSYIETYLTITGSSVLFKKEKMKFHGTVHVDISFLQEGKVIQANSYNLLSTEVMDTSKKPNFIDLQRYWLKPGSYVMQVKISDVNRPTAEALPGTQTIIIAEPAKDSIAVSDIEFLESYAKAEAPSITTKSGYDVIPYVLSYYPETVNKLAFYTEGYNTLQKLGNDSRFVFVYFIEGTETKEMVSGYHTFLKQKSAIVNPLLSQFDISQLPSGEYNLVVEIRNNTNELLASRKRPFTRVANKVKFKLEDIQTIDTTGTFTSRINNLDTLKDYIACLWPISSTAERDWQYNQIRKADSKLMQQYLYAFWVNKNEKNPEGEWKKYRAQANQVKKMYACGKTPGYMTDRGRVYLQYGQPNASQQVPAEPDSYPYEIWQYYRITDPTTKSFQSNKKFVFMNRQLDGKCFDLIHSDAKGEIRDDRWQIKLKQRTNQVLNLDQNTPQDSDNFGSGAGDLFQNPR